MLCRIALYIRSNIYIPEDCQWRLTNNNIYYYEYRTVKDNVKIYLQKATVDDQIIIKADFVQDKRPLMDENNFFKTASIELQIMIEI